jgi:transmembrane sensor
MTRTSHQEIDRQAAEWAAKRDSRHLAPGEQAEFDSWLAADLRHLGAYAKAETVLAVLERAGAVGPDTLRPMRKDGDLWARRAVLTGSVAASVAALAVGSRVAWRYLVSDGYTTRIGETRVIPLEDGSVITLNTNSRILVRYTEKRRNIYLLQGEALFEVAKNKTRPFVVLAGDTQVRAVGTSFTVKMLPEQPVQVLVQEGVVEVKRHNVGGAAPVRATANTLVMAPPDAPIATEMVTHSQLMRDLAWRVGRIAFDNKTLTDAADEFSRYSNTRIQIDPAIADQTITGLFVSNDPVGFARAVAISLNLRADVGEKEVRITR